MGTSHTLCRMAAASRRIWATQRQSRTSAGAKDEGVGTEPGAGDTATVRVLAGTGAQESREEVQALSLFVLCST